MGDEIFYASGKFIIPEYMADSIVRYVEWGYRPGNFLQAIICNDLINAVGYADDINLSNLPAYISYFYYEVPASCWGSKEKMYAWMELKRKESRDDKSSRID